MTQKQALLLASECFGKAGVVARRKSSAPGERFVVGIRVQEGVGVLGKGRSWEAAFADAEAHLAKQTEAK